MRSWKWYDGILSVIRFVIDNIIKIICNINSLRLMVECPVLGFHSEEEKKKKKSYQHEDFPSGPPP